MRRFYAKKRDRYVNYLSLLTPDPYRLDDTPINKDKQIVYFEEEILNLFKLHNDIEIVEVEGKVKKYVRI